ncbi:MAG: UvrD-helicase domain-containing protein [Nitrospirota bacterium]|jgi:DNA helicase-2/ATP-dependent DNA helicase PcrA
MSILAALNPVQRQAVEHRGTPLLILAGAGSGKTRTLTHRIAHLLATGDAQPHQILAVTFTNKAAREMRERIAALLGGTAPPGLWALTFHAFGARMLRAHAEVLGYPARFVIYDQNDRMTLVKQLVKEMRLNDRLYPPSSLAWRISELKNRLVTPDDYGAECRDFGIEAATREVYRHYQERLRRAGAVDFDDLLMLPVRLLEDVPPVRAQYQERFAHLLIDEYQDTNRAQYRLVRVLEGDNDNLCVVGDDDQSIYGWRGADLRNILDFERDHPGCLTLKLEQNYRSTPQILEAANHVIRHNLGRTGKALWTDRAAGELLACQSCMGEEAEAAYVMGEIARRRVAGSPLLDFAVLYRTHAQSRVLEAALRSHGLPYVIYGGQKFYERKEIKDCLAYLKVLENPADDLSFERIINLPPRGIGANLFVHLRSVAAHRHCSLFEAVSHALGDSDLATRQRNALTDLAALWERLGETHRRQPPLPELLETVLVETGLLDYLERDDSVEAVTRGENVRELATALQNLTEEDPLASLSAFLEQVALVTDLDQETEARDYVTLMTLHSAKGLEFPVVFLTGMEEGIFPHRMAMGSEDEMEEERRLAYVGITRAKEVLYLTFAARRHIQGEVQFNSPSRFLGEIPDNLVARPVGTSDRAAPDRAAILTRVVPVAGDGPFPVGSQVHHPRWGEGRVVRREGKGEDLKVSVRFTSVGVKRMVATKAPLQPLH